MLDFFVFVFVYLSVSKEVHILAKFILSDSTST